MAETESKPTTQDHDHPWRSAWFSRRDRAMLRYMLGQERDAHVREWLSDVLGRLADAPDWPMPNPPPFPADDEGQARSGA